MIATWYKAQSERETDFFSKLKGRQDIKIITPEKVFQTRSPTTRTKSALYNIIGSDVLISEVILERKIEGDIIREISLDVYLESQTTEQKDYVKNYLEKIFAIQLQEVEERKTGLKIIT